MLRTNQMSTTQAARALGLSKRQVFHRIRAGQIKGQKFDWIWMIPESEIARVQKTDWYKASKRQEPVEA